MTMTTDDAIRTINSLRTLPDDDADIYATIRTLLIDPDADIDADSRTSLEPLIRDTIRSLFANERDDDYYTRAALSDLMLNYSLCPMHRIDYAICFDDADDDCAAIRAYFPIHDT